MVARDSVTDKTAHSLFDLALANPNYIISGMLRVRTSRQTEGRNAIIKGFLQGPAEWLLWVDSDMTFTPDTFMYLWDRREESKIVTALAFMYDANTGAVAPNAMDYSPELDKYVPVEFDPKDSDKFFVDATGCAFTLIHRDVFQDMGFPWHEDLPAPAPAHDIYFYEKARQHGHRVLYIPWAKTGHVKNVEVDQNFYVRNLYPD